MGDLANAVKRLQQAVKDLENEEKQVKEVEAEVRRIKKLVNSIQNYPTYHGIGSILTAPAESVAAERLGAELNLLLATVKARTAAMKRLRIAQLEFWNEVLKVFNAGR